jgi:hypothetical protein
LGETTQIRAVHFHREGCGRVDRAVADVLQRLTIVRAASLIISPLQWNS